MGEQFWALVNSKIGLAALGFVFSTVFAGWINNEYQELAWMSKKQFEILQRTLDQQEELTQEIASLMDDRLFWLQKVYWAVQDDNEPNYIETLWKEDYYPAVVKWNRRLNNNIYRIKSLTRQADIEINKYFYTYEDDVSYQNPETAHGYFKAAHYAVRELACCHEVPGFCSHNTDKKRCVTDGKGIEQAVERRLQNLAQNNTKFLNNLQIAFDEHNNRLNIKRYSWPEIEF